MSVEVDVPPVVEAMVKSGVFAAVAMELEILRTEFGVVVPIPTLPPKYAPPVVVLFP
jgi:hypothetical protein